MTVALPDLSKLAEESGLDKRVGLFLRDKGVTNSGVLGHLFGDRSNIAKMLEPLKTGITMGTETIKLKDEEIDVTEAIIDHMVDQIELARKKQFATAAPGTPPSTPALTTPVTTATGDGKAPKQLPKGFSAKRIKEFEATKIEGHHRSFSVHLISGAEEVLARMVWEKETTNLFTPVCLGEVLAQRNLTPSKPWARHDDNMAGVLSLDASGSLVKKEKYVPEPQKVLTFIDAIDAVRWAMIFCMQVGRRTRRQPVRGVFHQHGSGQPQQAAAGS